jgi:hypothetical protein
MWCYGEAVAVPGAPSCQHAPWRVHQRSRPLCLAPAIHGRMAALDQEYNLLRRPSTTKCRSSLSLRPQVVRPRRHRDSRCWWFFVRFESISRFFLSDLGVLRLEVAGEWWRRSPSTGLLFPCFC